MDALIQKIKLFDDVTLRDIAGPSIVSAVRESYQTDSQSVLAEIICMEHGTSILDKLRIRDNIIDVSSKSDIESLANAVGINFSNRIQTAHKLHTYFRSYTESKSIVFAEWLLLPSEYCKKSLIDERNDRETITIRHGQDAVLKGYLHGYQKNVKDQIQQKLKHSGARAMVQMPTGSGKTYTALEAAVDTLREPFYRSFVVWFVHSNELAEQALQSFKSLWQIKGDRELDVLRLFSTFVPDFDKSPMGGVVFASYDIVSSILNNPNDQRHGQIKSLIGRTEFVIVDEAHSGAAETYSECIHEFVKDRKTRLLGLSATPFREDDQVEGELMSLFDGTLISLRDNENNVIDDPVLYLQKLGFLSSIKVITLETNIVCTQNNENGMLKELASDGIRNEKILKQINTAVEVGDQTLVFACTKDHVKALYILCKKEGLNVAFITGDVPQATRLKILDDFKEGVINVLINLEILSTGIDIPSLNRLIMTRPVRSPILYSQMVGRALRGPLNGGNACNTIVNVLDNLNHFPGINGLFNSFSTRWERTNADLL